MMADSSFEARLRRAPAPRAPDRDRRPPRHRQGRPRHRTRQYRARARARRAARATRARGRRPRAPRAAARRRARAAPNATTRASHHHGRARQSRKRAPRRNDEAPAAGPPPPRKRRTTAAGQRARAGEQPRADGAPTEAASGEHRHAPPASDRHVAAQPLKSARLPTRSRWRQAQRQQQPRRIAGCRACPAPTDQVRSDKSGHKAITRTGAPRLSISTARSDLIAPGLAQAGRALRRPPERREAGSTKQRPASSREARGKRRSSG